MKIELDKNIYDKDAIYQSIEVWNEYLYTPTVSESSKSIYIEIEDIQLDIKIINEFLNYVLDLTSSKELL